MAAGETIRYQTPQPLFQGVEAAANKIRVVVAGATLTLGPYHVVGFGELVGSIRADQAGACVVEGNVLNGVGAWFTLWSQPVMVAGTTYPIIVPIVADYVRIRITAPGAPAPNMNIQVEGQFMPSGSHAASLGGAFPGVVDLKSVITDHHVAAVAVGNGTDAVLDGSLSVADVSLIATAGVVATILFQKSEDGVNFVNVPAWNQNNGQIVDPNLGYASNGATNLLFQVNVAGAVRLRVRINAYAGGGGDSVTIRSKAIEGADADLLPKAVGGGAAGLDTQRLIIATNNPTYGQNNSNSPTHGEAVMGFQSRLDTEISQGNYGIIRVDRFRRPWNPAYSEPHGADYSHDVAPWQGDQEIFTLRDAAALPAAGAFDATPRTLQTFGKASCLLLLTYTPGAAGGAFRLRIDHGNVDPVAGQIWARDPAVNAAVFASGADGVEQVTSSYKDFQSITPGVANYFRYAIPINGADSIRIAAAETGVVGTPGNLTIRAIFFNVPVVLPIPSDSKAYVSGTNLRRGQETNPLSAQYVVEQLLYTAAYPANTTLWYPSANGAPHAGYKDLSIDFQMIAGALNTVTLTVEATDDDVTPTWHDITMAGYELQTNAVGAASFVTAIAGTLNGILDFDELNVKLWRIKIVSSNGGAAVSTVKLFARRKAL
jgi:hypothetical protein